VSASSASPSESDVQRIIEGSSVRTGFKDWLEIERMLRCAWGDGYRAGESREHTVHGGKPINDACPGCGNTGDGHYAGCPRARG
jgi:hypothetical protein